MLHIQLIDKTGNWRDGRPVTNWALFPKDWDKNSNLEYRFTFRNHHGDDISCDTFRPVSQLLNDPLYMCSTRDPLYKDAAEKRVYGQ